MARYELDIHHPEHIPAPTLNAHIAREIEALLPRNPFGEPQLIVEWGMDAKCFRNGDPKATKYVALHQVIKTTKWRRLDPVEGKYEYFDKRDDAVNALNIRLLPLLEHETTKTVRVFGPPRFVVAQWFPAERIDPSKKHWDTIRIGSYTNKKHELVKFDALGPYPARGQYRELMIVENEDGTFRDLDAALVYELRRRIKERELYSYNDHADAQGVRDMIAEELAKQAAEEKLIEDEFVDSVGPSGYRLIEGNAWSGFGGTAEQAARANK